jgi:threonyl-tRNA synthetase
VSGQENNMTNTRPLTSQEIDDGWFLETARPAIDDEPYLEFTIKSMTPEDLRKTSSRFRQILRDRNRSKRAKRRHGKATRRFERRRGRRSRRGWSE